MYFEVSWNSRSNRIFNLSYEKSLVKVAISFVFYTVPIISGFLLIVSVMKRLEYHSNNTLCTDLYICFKKIIDENRSQID